jgi:phage shock protein PspC (stress-responsive transcriptional regulator)
MTKASCSRSTEQLTRYLSEGGGLPPELIEHVRDCSACGETVRRAQLLGDLLERSQDEPPAPAAPPALSQVMMKEVAAAVRRRRLLRAGLAIVIVALGVATWSLTGTAVRVRYPYAVWSILMILFAGPLALVAITAGIDAGGPSRLYKRIRRHQLSGVCQGLSEATRVPVWIWRMVFVGLIFLKGVGVILYLVLSVVLPVHPDDRAGLLRFRIGRWWRNRRAVGPARPQATVER